MSHTCQQHKHTACRRTAIEGAEAYCMAQGLRFTDIRRDVFEIIWRSHKALTAAEIMAELAKCQHNSQPPTTYRALEFLTDNGLVHHIASLNAYVGCTHISKHMTDCGDAYGHEACGHIGQLLICTDCRTVAELELNTPVENLRHAAAQSGFAVQQTHIEMLGLCQRCQGTRGTEHVHA